MAEVVRQVAVPTLSDDGWVYSSMKMADYLMACFLASQKSQSFLFFDQISSFAWLVATYSNNPNVLIENTQKTLQLLFSKHFENVVVECNDATRPEAPSKFILSLYLEFRLADGTTSNISKLAQITDSKFILINKAINEGL